MNRIHQTDSAPAHPPADMYMAILGNDGSFRWYKPFHYARHKYVYELGDDVYRLSRAESLIDGTWCCNRNDTDKGQWRAAAHQPRKLEKVVYVRAEDWGDRMAAIAEHAATFAEIPIPDLNRRRDGYFYCPHCDARYDPLGPFQNHLAYRCKDEGAEYLTQSTAFWQRNRSSRKAWLLTRGAATAENIAKPLPKSAIKALRERASNPMFLALTDDGCPLSKQYRQIGVEHHLLGYTASELASKHEMSTAEVRKVLRFLKGWHKGTTSMEGK